MSETSHVALPATPRTDEIAAKLEREGLQYSFRIEYVYECMREMERELAEAHDALGSLQEMLAKQIAVPYGLSIQCAACGEVDDKHTEGCVVDRGLKIIEATLHSSWSAQEKP